MERWAAVAFVVVSAAVLSGCGTERGRVPFTEAGARTATVALEAGPVGLWTELDVEHVGDAELMYDIELVQGGEVVATARCNPLGPVSVKMNWTERHFDGEHRRKGLGKMACEAAVPVAGPTEVRSVLRAEQRGPRLELRRADLVLKQ